MSSSAGGATGAWQVTTSRLSGTRARSGKTSATAASLPFASAALFCCCCSRSLVISCKALRCAAVSTSSSPSSGSNQHQRRQQCINIRCSANRAVPIVEARSRSPPNPQPVGDPCRHIAALVNSVVFCCVLLCCQGAVKSSVQQQTTWLTQQQHRDHQKDNTQKTTTVSTATSAPATLPKRFNPPAVASSWPHCRSASIHLPWPHRHPAGSA